MTRPGYELDFGSGNELGEALTMHRRAMMIPLAPQCKRGTTNLLVISSSAPKRTHGRAHRNRSPRV